MRRSDPNGPVRCPTRRLAAVDAQEIKTAVAHQEAARSAAETPFVNLADPALAIGADGAPAVSRRAPIWDDIPDAQWNDWRWQLSHRVNALAEIEQVLELRCVEVGHAQQIGGGSGGAHADIIAASARHR
jgi:hypothetical protein